MSMSVTSMHTDRKAIGHIAKLVGVRALVLNYRRSPEHKFRTQLMAPTGLL
jgi:monoterpene epsilon-lactone hydrolase